MKSSSIELTSLGTFTHELNNKLYLYQDKLSKEDLQVIKEYLTLRIAEIEYAINKR